LYGALRVVKVVPRYGFHLDDARFAKHKRLLRLHAGVNERWKRVIQNGSRCKLSCLPVASS
jgi:hypothetical protein